MTPEYAMLIKILIGIMIVFGAFGIVYAIISLWEEYWSNKEYVERYKKNIAEFESEREEIEHRKK